MSQKPRTLELCHKLIDRLTVENAAMSDALHKMSNDCAVVLANKDRQLEEKCQRCRRGLGESRI